MLSIKQLKKETVKAGFLEKCFTFIFFIAAILFHYYFPMIQPQNFASISTFIDHLKQKAEIIGILQYGSRDYRDMGLGGDFDLILIVDSAFVTPISGLHFHIQNIPVDCGIIQIEDLYRDTSPSDFHFILLDADILFDRKEILSKRLSILKNQWAWDIPSITEGEIAFERFIKQHIFDKFEHRAFEDEVYTRVFLSGNVFWLLELYMKIERLNPYNFKSALTKMRTHNSEMYALFKAFEMTHDLHEKLRITRLLNQEVLKKVGGPWRKNEVIFHYVDSDATYSEAEKAQIIGLIF